MHGILCSKSLRREQNRTFGLAAGSSLAAAGKTLGQAGGKKTDDKWARDRLGGAAGRAGGRAALHMYVLL